MRVKHIWHERAILAEAKLARRRQVGNVACDGVAGAPIKLKQFDTN